MPETLQKAATILHAEDSYVVPYFCSLRGCNKLYLPSFHNEYGATVSVNEFAPNEVVCEALEVREQVGNIVGYCYSANFYSHQLQKTIGGWHTGLKVDEAHRRKGLSGALYALHIKLNGKKHIEIQNYRNSLLEFFMRQGYVPTQVLDLLSEKSLDLEPEDIKRLCFNVAINENTLPEGKLMFPGLSKVKLVLDEGASKPLVESIEETRRDFGYMTGGFYDRD